MQLIVTRLIAIKSLLLLSREATSFQLQLPNVGGYHTTRSAGWDLPPATPSTLVSLSTPSSSSPDQQPSPPLTFATPEQVQQLLAEYPNTILLDVRSEDEIVEHGHLQVSGHRWVHTSCTPAACPMLSSPAGDSLLPDKQVPVLVYCASGKRAAKAKEVLESKGYQIVLNAGAFKDLNYL